MTNFLVKLFFLVFVGRIKATNKSASHKRSATHIVKPDRNPVAAGDSNSHEQSHFESSNMLVVWAGLGAGAFVLVLVTVVVLCCCIERRKRRRRERDGARRSDEENIIGARGQSRVTTRPLIWETFWNRFALCNSYEHTSLTLDHSCRLPSTCSSNDRFRFLLTAALDQTGQSDKTPPTEYINTLERGGFGASADRCSEVNKPCINISCVTRKSINVQHEV